MNRALCVVVATCVIWSGCSKHASSEAADEGGSAAPVQVAAVKQQDLDRFVNAEGILYPVQQATIVPKISAPVARFLVQRGDHVRAGQLVAVLEHEDLAAAARESRDLYAGAEATFANTSRATLVEDLTKAQQDVQASQEALDAAQRLYENRKALLNQGALAQKLVDDAHVAMVQAKAQYETAQQHLKSLQSVGREQQLRSAQAQLDAAKAHYQGSQAQEAYAEVRSPVSGVVSDRPLNIGEMASSGSALLSVVDLSRVVARTNITVAQAAFIRIGNAATLSGPGGDLTGKVTVVSPAVDPNTTTVQVWVEAANPQEVFKPGTAVHVSIHAGTSPGALVIPASALLSSDEGGERVMVAGSDGRAHERDVKVGVRSGDLVQVVEGVKTGEQVITQGALGLDDKAKVVVGEAAKGESSDEKKEDQ